MGLGVIMVIGFGDRGVIYIEVLGNCPEIVASAGGAVGSYSVESLYISLDLCVPTV
jgi:hypothetical protein